MNKTKVLTIRIEEKDLKLIIEAAAATDLSISKYIRQAAREKSLEILSGGVINGQIQDAENSV